MNIHTKDDQAYNNLEVGLKFRYDTKQTHCYH